MAKKFNKFSEIKIINPIFIVPDTFLINVPKVYGSEAFCLDT